MVARQAETVLGGELSSFSRWIAFLGCFGSALGKKSSINILAAQVIFPLFLSLNYTLPLM